MGIEIDRRRWSSIKAAVRYYRLEGFEVWRVTVPGLLFELEHRGESWVRSAQVDLSELFLQAG